MEISEKSRMHDFGKGSPEGKFQDRYRDVGWKYVNE